MEHESSESIRKRRVDGYTPGRCRAEFWVYDADLELGRLKAEIKAIKDIIGAAHEDTAPTACQWVWDRLKDFPI